MPVLLTREELNDWILVQLGAPLVTVHLQSIHLCTAIDDAIRWFTAKKGVRKVGELTAVPNQIEYILPLDVDVVTEVFFTSQPIDVSSIFPNFLVPDQQIPYSAVFSNPQNAGGFYSNVTQVLQYVEEAKRITGSEEGWEQDPEGRKLLLFPRMLQGKVIYYYKTNVFTLEQLKERDHDLVKRYALAIAKRILGRIRYFQADGYNAAVGKVNLDGLNLLQESKEDIAALDREIMLSAHPMNILIG